MLQGLLALGRQARPALAMVWQNGGQELLLVPVSKAVHCQLVCVLCLAVVLLHENSNA